MAREGYPEYVASVIQQRENELEKSRGKYQLARAQTAGRNGEDLIKLFKLLRSYRPGESPEKAVYILAQVTTLLAALVEPYLVIEDYEGRERTIDKVREQTQPIHPVMQGMMEAE